MERVRLKFKGVSEIVGSDEIGLLILTDIAEQNQLAIPCDRAMIREFGLRIGHAEVVGRLLPEVLWHVIAMQTNMQFEVLITDIMGAREVDPGDIRSEMLIGPLRRRGVDAVLTPTFNDAEAYLRAHWQAGDVMISHGCGNIDLLNEQIALHGDTPAK